MKSHFMEMPLQIPFPLDFYYKSLQSHALNQYKINYDPH